MRRAGAIAGVVLLLAGAFVLGLFATRAHDGGGAPLATGERDRPPQVIDEVRYDLVTSYYRDIPPAALARDSIDEIIARLKDPYTDYLTPFEYASLRSRTERSYSGVGLTVGFARGGLIVKAALQGPAREAGIRPGDLIVSIDGRRVRRLPFNRSLELIKGEEGTMVRLMVKRPREGTLNFTVKREEIELPALRARMLAVRGSKLGYVRLLSFRAGAAERLARVAASLVKAGADGLVLDLRGNPGGLLSQAVRAVSLFVDDGVVCATRAAHERRRVYEVSGNAAYPRLPLAVLVDRSSASAAEIVAAALADHERAVVVGQRTYGKAAVQSVHELSNGAALKLTAAVFLTPSGHNLTARGLVPDVRAVDDARTRRDEALAAAKRVLLGQLTK